MKGKARLDEVDKKIIFLLQKNGRATLSKIGEETNMTHVGVKRRLEKLTKEELIEISALLNPAKLELRAALILADVESYPRLQEIINMFKYCPRILCLSTLSGAYNLMAIIVAENIDTLESMILGACAIRNQRGIRRSNIQIVESFSYPIYLPIRLVAEKKLNEAPCGFICKNCERYKLNKCLGCPTTKFYKGPL